MSWTLSRFRAGDVVEVRSKREILATLDAQGCLDGLPFMPEMLQFCGRQVTIRAVAHKTCEVAYHTGLGRRLDRAVHFGRCDGSAHGGCQAQCSLFWKDEWLKPAGAAHASGDGVLCSEERLWSLVREPVTAENPDPNYVCQATRIFGATLPLPWWDVRQYVYDVLSRNHSLARVARAGWLAALRAVARRFERIPGPRGATRRFSEAMHRVMTGRAVPQLFATRQPLQKTPTGRLDLKVGEWIRVRSQTEIEATLDKTGRNRGLSFDAEEMGPFCGGTFRVQSTVLQILDEATGKMRLMKEPCIILEGVTCRAEYARCRLNCPRAYFSYWRELWLERVEPKSH